MTVEEWGTVKRRLVSWWTVRQSDPFDEEAYFDLLGGFDKDEVVAALKRISERQPTDRRWFPKAGEIAAAVQSARPAADLVVVNAKRRGASGEEAMRRLPPTPWLIKGRRFFPVADSVLVVDRKDDQVVSCSGWWDQDEGDHMVWESWSTALVGAAKRLAA